MAAPDEEIDTREAFAVLCDMARRRDEHIPAEVLARQAMRVSEGGDWPVQRAAMQAIIRRQGFAARDALSVASKPPGGRVLGVYATRVPGRNGRRPYRTLLAGVDPIAGSCDCRDFCRSSLGVCKHLLVVLEHVYASERRLARAREAGGVETVLSWDPVRPLCGPGDWLDGVSWRAARGKPSAAEKRAKALFDPTGRLIRAHADNPKKRLEVVDLLLAVAHDGEPALEALLTRERAKLAERLKTVALARQAKKWSRGLVRRLYPYQEEGVRRFLETGRLLLGDDMGLGKTTQAVACCHALATNGHVRRGIIITPASLKWQWLREWQSVSDVPASIVDGPRKEREKAYRDLRRGFLIINYELLLRDGKAIRDLRPDMVVLDEAQRIKNWATKTAAEVKSLRPPFRLVLTGTPMENRLDELASIYDWVDDLALEPKWRLGAWHAVEVQASDRLSGDVVGARNLDTLRQRIAPTFCRRVRKDVLSELPPRTETRVPVPLTAQQRAAHTDLDQPVARLLAAAKRRPLRQSEFLRLMSLLTTQRIICNGLAQLQFEAVWPALPSGGPRGLIQLQGLFSPKLEELRHIVEEIVVDQGRKVVVFSQWRRMLQLAAWAVSDILARNGRRAVFFTGAESTKQRTRGIVELHDDPATSVMFLSDAGGVGLNLQRAVSACINLELPWNPAVLEQRIGRIHRLGQDEPVDIYNLVSEAGIEARIHEVVGAKRELFDGLFDGTSDEIIFSGAASAIARIEKLVDTGALAAHDLEEGAEDEVEEEAEVDEDTEAEVEALTDDRLLEAPAPVSAPDVQRLLSSLSVRSTEGGGIILEAPPESAQALASLFGTMAKLLEQSAQPHD